MEQPDKKTILLDCAEDLIQRVGVNAMSYQDISKTVGITKAGIHHHFPKKEDMVVELLGRCKVSYAETYRSVASSKKSAVKKLEEIAGIFETSLKKNKVCLIGMLSTEQGSLGKEIKKALETSIEESTDIFESIFIQAKEENIIKKRTDTNKAAYAFLSFLLGGQILSRCTGNVEAFSAAARQYIRGLKEE